MVNETEYGINVSHVLLLILPLPIIGHVTHTMHYNTLIIVLIYKWDNTGLCLLGQKVEVILEPFVIGMPEEADSGRKQYMGPNLGQRWEGRWVYARVSNHGGHLLFVLRV